MAKQPDNNHGRSGTGVTGNDPLWDPKYSAVGVVAIVLMILLVEVLPGKVAARAKGATAPSSPPGVHPWE